MTQQVVLKDVPLFSQLSDETLVEVTAALKPRALQAGEILFNRGDPGNELIIVDQGRISIYEPQVGAPAVGKAIRIFQPGQMLGEMALVDQKPRSLSARAEEASVVLTLAGEDFQHLLRENETIVLSVMRGLSERIRYTTDFLGEVRRWVQSMAVGDYQASTNLSTNTQYQDATLATLAAEFATMAAKVQEREDQLRQEVAQLRIEIDESKRKQDVQDIVGSDYYLRLKDKIKKMREEMSEDE
jgi:CRP-like cAMP-binding protein